MAARRSPCAENPDITNRDRPAIAISGIKVARVSDCGGHTRAYMAVVCHLVFCLRCCCAIKTRGGRVGRSCW